MLTPEATIEIEEYTAVEGGEILDKLALELLPPMLDLVLILAGILGRSSTSSVAQDASKVLPRQDSGRRGVFVIYGPLDDGGIPEECHSFLRALPEVLQCMYVMKVPVYL